MLWNRQKCCSVALVVALVSFLAACGDSGSSGSGVTLSKLTVTPATVSIPLGTTQQLTVMGTYSNGTTKNLTSQVVWSVAPATIAKVSSGGLLTSTAKGSATVNATMTAVVGHVGVTVQSAAVTKIQLAPAAPAIPLGTTQQMTATATYTDGTSGDVTSSVAWAADRKSVV